MSGAGALSFARLIRRHWLHGCAVGALVLTVPVMVGSQAASATVAVSGGISVSALPGASAFGNTPPATPETVSFVLREQNLQQLEAAVTNGTTGDLSVSQFAHSYGQSAANITALKSYLAGYGISTQVYPDDVDVVANGTAGEFDAALSVQQREYHVPAQPGRDGLRAVPAQTVHGVTTSPSLPAPIASYVVAILGLTNYGPFESQALSIDKALTHPRSAGSNSCLALTGLPDACNTPTSFAADYGLDPLYRAGAEGQGQTVAIVTLAALDPGAPEWFWKNVMNLPPASYNRPVTVVNVDGGPGAPSDASGTGETDLDVEQSGGVAPDASVIVYQAPNTDYGFADAFFDAASQDIAGSISTSWGESETYLEASIASGLESPGYIAAFDEAFLEMAAQGEAGFDAAGDSGAYDASGDIGTTNLSVDTPADSPYMTASGGTTLPWSGSLSGPGGTVTVTVPSQRTWGWDYLWQATATTQEMSLTDAAESLVFGGGGGFSVLEQEPSYQVGVPGTSSYSALQYLTPIDYENVDGVYEPTEWSFNPTPSVSHGSGRGRAVPDVSVNADPDSGYLLYEPSWAAIGEPVLQGGWGGTSFSAPQLNGSTAVIDSYLGRRVGFWNPHIYPLATGSGSPFTPLEQTGTGSDNIYYTGSPGVLYNEGSGLGVPDLSKLAYELAYSYAG